MVIHINKFNHVLNETYCLMLSLSTVYNDLEYWNFLADGVISKEELKSFYQHISGITDAKTLERTTNEGYRALTANGDYKLNKQNYLFAFANFLLAKGIYGPGKYLFGTFDNREIDESYKVVYNDDSDMEDWIKNKNQCLI